MVVDDDTRVAFMSMFVVLGLNGRCFRADPAHATASVLALAAGEIDEDRFAHWVKETLA